MATRLLAALAAGGLLVNVAATDVGAHYAFNSEFDAAKPVKSTGVVKKMEWINPHSWLTIDVKRPDGTMETWEIEAGAQRDVPAGLQPEFAAGRNRSRRQRFSGQGWKKAGERPRHLVAGREKTVHGLIGDAGRP